MSEGNVLSTQGEGAGGESASGDASQSAADRSSERPALPGTRWLRACRVPLFAVGHVVLFALSFWCAFQLRFDFDVPSHYAEIFRFSLAWFVGVKLLVFFALGQYHGLWHYVTFADLLALLRATLVSLVIIVGIDYFVVVGYQIPRAILLLDCMLTVLLLGALRASWRLFVERFRPMVRAGDTRWALVVGVDHASAILAYQIQSNFQLPYRIRGFLTTGDSETQRGARLGQIPVLGSVDELDEITSSYAVHEVLVTAGTLTGEQLRRLMEDCRRAGLQLRVIRPAEDRLRGDHRIPIRDIEISDLLRRDPIHLDTETIGRLIAGRRVMVSGAGGSIGSEICRQVLRFQPRALILLGRGENRIFAIERELRQAQPEAVLNACIGDVTDAERMRVLFGRYRPEVVFHAAAHKHVPLMEANVGEAIKNNVGGTKCIADLADEFGVQNFVLISTDKVVHPTSIMGVSKQIAERYVHALSQESATRFTVVRFGNVLGSAGSVVPIFQQQIRNGGPITITDPRMRRFFMTIPEASQLVLQAAAMGRGGEIFVLEMGKPVRIVELARDLIRLSGLPEESIEIEFTGIRPGEKLYEELYFSEEHTLPTTHPKVRAAYHRPFSLSEVRAAIGQLVGLLHAPEAALRKKLKEICPEFVPPGEPDVAATPVVEGEVIKRSA